MPYALVNYNNIFKKYIATFEDIFYNKMQGETCEKEKTIRNEYPNFWDYAGIYSCWMC